MNVKCPNCNQNSTLGFSTIPPGDFTFQCKHCSNHFTAKVQPGGKIITHIETPSSRESSENSNLEQATQESHGTKRVSKFSNFKKNASEKSQSSAAQSDASQNSNAPPPSFTKQRTGGFRTVSYTQQNTSSEESPKTDAPPSFTKQQTGGFRTVASEKQSQDPQTGVNSADLTPPPSLQKKQTGVNSADLTPPPSLQKKQTGGFRTVSYTQQNTDSEESPKADAPPSFTKKQTGGFQPVSQQNLAAVGGPKDDAPPSFTKKQTGGFQPVSQQNLAAVGGPKDDAPPSFTRKQTGGFQPVSQQDLTAVGGELASSLASNSEISVSTKAQTQRWKTKKPVLPSSKSKATSKTSKLTGSLQSLYNLRDSHGKTLGSYDLDTLFRMLEAEKLTGEEELGEEGDAWVKLSDSPHFSDWFQSSPGKREQAQSKTKSSARKEPRVEKDTAEPEANSTQEEAKKDKPAYSFMSRSEDPLVQAQQKAMSGIMYSKKETKVTRPLSLDEEDDYQAGQMANLEGLIDVQAVEKVERSHRLLAVSSTILFILVCLSIYHETDWFKPKSKKGVRKLVIHVPFQPEQLFVKDSLVDYQRYIRHVERELKSHPKHQALLIHYSLGIGFLLENYGPDQKLLKKMKQSLEFLAQRKNRKVGYYETWAQAMFALQKRQAQKSIELANLMRQRFTRGLSIPSYYIRSRGFILTKKYEQANEDINEVLEAHPNSPRALLLRAKALLNSGEFKDSYFNHLSILNQHPQHYPTYLSLARFDNEDANRQQREFFKTNFWKKADKLFLKHPYPKAKSKYFIILAQRSEEKGDLTSATQYLKKAMKFAGDNRNIEREYLELILRTSMYHQLRKELVKRLKKPQLSTEVIVLWMKFMLRTNQIKKAIKQIKKKTQRCKLCSNDDRYWLGLGLLYERATQYKKAIRHVNRALLLNSDSTANLALKGILAIKTNNKKVAEQAQKSLEDTEVVTYQDRVLVAEFLFLRSEFEAATELLAPLRKSHAKDASVNRLFGRIWLRQKDLTKASHYFEKANQSWPSHPRTQWYLFQVHWLRGKSNKAIELIMQMQKQSFSEVEKVNQLGQALLQTKKYKLAIAFLKKNLSKFPKEANLHLMLGKAYDKNKQSALALQHFQKALRMEPEENEIIFALLHHLSRQGPASKKKAIAMFDKVLENKETGLEKKILYYKQQAQILSSLGELEQAKESCNLIESLDPGDSYAQINTAQCLHKIKRYELAMKRYKLLLRKLRKTRPSKEKEEQFDQWKNISYSAQVGLGNLYYTDKQYKASIEYYQSAVKLDPELGQTHFRLGKAYQQLRKWKKCQKHYQKYMKLSPLQEPYFPKAYQGYATCQAKNG